MPPSDPLLAANDGSRLCGGRCTPILNSGTTEAAGHGVATVAPAVVDGPAAPVVAGSVPLPAVVPLPPVVGATLDAAVVGAVLVANFLSLLQLAPMMAIAVKSTAAGVRPLMENPPIRARRARATEIIY